MLIRISLIIAIVASLATAGISFFQVKGKITTLMSERDNERTQKETALNDLSSTRKELTVTKKDLDKTKADLATTTGERDRALTEASSEKKRATELADKLNKTTTDRDNAQSELAAWKAIGPSVDQIKGIIVQSKQLQQERANLQTKLTDLIRLHREATNTLAKITGGDSYSVSLPPELRGKVVVVDPKYDFVVLDIGEKQGALEDGILLVNRNGKLVAKLKIRSVQSDRSIANVIPGWKLGEVMEGDLVLPVLSGI